ncbi:protein lethal(2)k10201 [Toxorhynchites rutilus septentrionalis]|uniref:protein lethal(2)k10201 n=1 Tax=Toxorhynchites rutilus septentrionalis TaxID=329112 RepID=UPI0024786AEE|nr:protein lethal(2)k10201 [Toxorhynchites rutilus septentrionalis]
MSNFTSPEIVLKLLDKYGTGFREQNDEFFTDGNFYIKKFVKLGVLSDIEKCAPKQPEETVITCNVPECRYSSSSVQDYECHYNSLHRYSCGECKKTLPNAHLLDLHLLETHDSYFAAQVQTGKRPMYSCYLDGCDHKSRDPAERRDHCIKEHKFPHNFRFDKQVTPAQKQPKVGSSPNSKSASAEMEVEPVEPNQAAAAPKCFNFNFGHSKTKSFKSSKASKKTDVFESNKMVVDLLESLPEV